METPLLRHQCWSTPLQISVLLVPATTLDFPMLPVRSVFAFVCMTAILFFTHLLHHTDDPEQSTLSPKEWISILRTANLAERAAGLHQWVSNHSQGMLINGGALSSRQFERLEIAENRLKQTMGSIAVSSETLTKSATSNADLPTSVLIYADKGEVKTKQYFDNKTPTMSVSTSNNPPSTKTETIKAMTVHNKTTKPKKSRPTREPRSTNKGFVVSDAVNYHPRISPREGTDVSTDALQMAALHCPNQSKCIVPALQLQSKLKIYYCKHPVRQGVRFWNLIHEGLLMHPNVELLAESQLSQADFVIYLPGSAPWHRTECANVTLSNKMIVLDEFDFHNLYYPKPTPEEVVEIYGSMQWYFMYYKRSFVRRKHGKFLSYPHFVLPQVYPMTYALAEAYTMTHQFNFQREIEILCTLRGSKQMSTRLRVQEWVAEYGQQNNISNMISKQVNRADRTGVSKEYFEQMYNSQIIVTVNPAHWEGDFRLWESMATGALVLSDPLFVPYPNPLLNGVHIVYFSNENKTDLFTKLDYYRKHKEEARRIAFNGYLHAMKYHRTVNLLDYVLRSAHLQRAIVQGQQPLPHYQFTAQYLNQETKRQQHDIKKYDRPAQLHPHGHNR